MKNTDNRIIMTLDAGGTNLVFSAICNAREIVSPLKLEACANNLEACLSQIIKGFKEVELQLPYKASAISFAFPGPADYDKGIIGDLPNFPSFRGGIALGPMLENIFNMPVYINNDGNLFALGEAYAGLLPETNKKLKCVNSNKHYKNLIGVTLGTGFGCGVVIDHHLLIGDNSTGGDCWCFKNSKFPEMIAEESVSIRAIKRVYEELSDDNRELTPFDIYTIAEGKRDGDREAAQQSFYELGEMTGEALASIITLIDGLVVIGGGISGASKYILPGIMDRLNRPLGTFSGEKIDRLQMKVFDLNNEETFNRFAKGEAKEIKVPYSTKTITYDSERRIGIGFSKLGASQSIALGAYYFAISKLTIYSDEKQ